MADSTNPISANSGDIEVVDIELAPELAAIVRGGPDVSVDLIELDQLKAWQSRAEVRLRLEIQRGKSEYLNELLQLAEQSEDDFLRRFDIQSLAAGETAGYQLRMFRLIRSRVENEMQLTKTSITQLESLLAKMSPTTSSNNTVTAFKSTRN